MRTAKDRTKKPPTHAITWGGMSIGEPLPPPQRLTTGELEAMGQLRLFPDGDVPPISGASGTGGASPASKDRPGKRSLRGARKATA